VDGEDILCSLVDIYFVCHWLLIRID